MMGANIAPGMHREFQAQKWENIVSPKLFARGFEEAESLVDLSVEMDIQGYDIDPQIVKAARENAKRAGVDLSLIHIYPSPWVCVLFVDNRIGSFYGKVCEINTGPNHLRNREKTFSKRSL